MNESKKEPQLKGIKVNIKTNLDELSKLFDELDKRAEYMYCLLLDKLSKLFDELGRIIKAINDYLKNVKNIWNFETFCPLKAY